MREKQIRKLFLLLTASVLLGHNSTLFSKENPSLRREWEGLFTSHNFRDMGKSLNECLGVEVFQEKRFLRANRYFTGWTCRNIGDPEAILSLNYKPEENKKFYCIDKNQKNLEGQIFNPTFEITWIEDLENWKNPEFRQSLCDAFKYAMNEIAAEHRFLVHCNAGRDRTGTYSAMIYAGVLEHKSLMDTHMLNAIECDYEKTKSLKREKYGHMKDVITKFQGLGGVKKFLADQCQIHNDQWTVLSEKLLLTNLKK